MTISCQITLLHMHTGIYFISLIVIVQMHVYFYLCYVHVHIILSVTYVTYKLSLHCVTSAKSVYKGRLGLIKWPTSLSLTRNLKCMENYRIGTLQPYKEYSHTTSDHLFVLPSSLSLFFSPITFIAAVPVYWRLIVSPLFPHSSW